MKKLKLLPSILMLIACVAILGVGVFAVAPTQNKISGSISINASNTSVKIEFLTNGVLKETHNEVRGGVSWDLSDVAFDTATVNTVEEVSPIVFTIRITNLSSTQGLGVYFFDTSTSLAMEDEKNGDVIIHYGGTAKAENILLKQTIYASGAEKTDANKIADVWFTPYTYLAKDDGNTTDEELDVVEMNATLTCFQLPGETVANDFSFQLNIEPYYANIASEDVKKASYEVVDYGFQWDGISCNTIFTNALLKLPEDLTQMPFGAFYGISNIDHVVFSAPISFEKCSNDFGDCSYNLAFDGCSVKGLSIIGAVTSYGDTNGDEGFGFVAEIILYNSISVGDDCFFNGLDFDKISFSSNLTHIDNGSNATYCNSEGFEAVFLSTTPPTLSDEYVFGGAKRIIVPNGSLETYKTAEDWSYVADNICEMSAK